MSSTGAREMLLKRVRIKNFRSIREVTVDIGSQVAIVGGNGTGKSSVLRAIDRFFGPSTTVELDDFFAARSKNRSKSDSRSPDSMSSNVRCLGRAFTTTR
jgi:predicted ATP-dependent endonuclease of OLD family